MKRIDRFKDELARVFDDDLHTKQWHNYFDYAIIGLIVVSTLQVFVSTFEVSTQFEHVLRWIDLITTLIFTVEVTLRIWAADKIDPKYKGLKGRLRYCFSFYGFIDMVSTYPFYLTFWFPIPYSLLKVFRVARLFRVFRYMHSFKLLARAFRSKKEELSISMQVLAIVTVILSFILFFYEHQAQPEVYDNGFVSVVWAFAQYIGDPGGFADTPPITFVGRLIACIIGLLGIALFAVPAGLVGAGFSEAMEEEKLSRKINNNISSIIHSFKFEKDQQHTQLFFVPRYKYVNLINTRKYLPYDDILEAVKESDCLHLCDLADSMNYADHPESKVVIVNFKRNTPYGCCIDRGSRVTIVSTSGTTEPCTSWLAYHIAKLGGFNYVAKEVETDLDNPTSYYNIPNNSKCPNLQMFLDDISRLANRPESWVISFLAATGTKSRPEQFHFCYNTTKHDSSYNDSQSLIKNYDVFDKLYNHIAANVDKKYGYKCDKNEWYAINKQNFGHRIATASNIFTLRIESFVWVFDSRWGSVVRGLARDIHDIIEPERPLEDPQEMVTRPDGKDFGMQDYVD